ncbi:globin domain-containing protein [Streptomyces sp. NPDC051219]|uniref:globin domain-containing protein n=1 Tax=Streptomyces sp. NPDC051219 TaxID=3155283 RepID=UPI003420EEAE
MDVKILKSSFAVVERRAEDAVKFFYSHLFWHHPGLRALFPAGHEDMQRQRDRLFAALTHVVAHLEDPSLPGYLQDLGRDHRKFLVGPEHYTAVGTSLIAALAEASGSAWTPVVEKAWTEAYAVLADAMIAGAESTDEPPWWDAEIVRHLRYGDGVAVLTLLPEQPLPYTPGQYVSVSSARAPGTWRTYSIANAPRADLTVDLHISRVEGGRLSTALVRDAREGEVLRLGAAGGAMTLDTESARPVTFVAAGTGWSPVKAMLEELAARPVGPSTPEVRLFAVARDAACLYDRPAVEALQDASPWPAVTYITPAPGRPGTHATERLAAALATRGNWPAQDVFISGPAAFIEEIAEVVAQLGADESRTFYDSVPATGEQLTRQLGPGAWFLTPPDPGWHNPAARTPRSPND